jgi:hypothetical protein
MPEEVMEGAKVEPLRHPDFDEQGDAIGQDIILRAPGKLAPVNAAKVNGWPSKNSPNFNRAQFSNRVKGE